jgi:hypothetical protein
VVKSGTVIHLDYASNMGVIETKGGVEFFFRVTECVEGELPPLYSLVTFIKDPDYKATNVAMLIKRSAIKLVA